LGSHAERGNQIAHGAAWEGDWFPRSAWEPNDQPRARLLAGPRSAMRWCRNFERIPSR
jgi:hypothetical protein